MGIGSTYVPCGGSVQFDIYVCPPLQGFAHNNTASSLMLRHELNLPSMMVVGIVFCLRVKEHLGPE